MAPEKPKYSKSAVQKAGKFLRKTEEHTKNPTRFAECMDILSNWKACHITVLKEVTENLSNASIKVHKNSIVVSRLKRTPSIINKLSRNNKMNLDRMQDVAGCRSIVGSIRQINRIKKELKSKYTLKETDYIATPKNDGYRCLHLIGKHNDYNFEIQIRTDLQHAWGTAVEIVDLFTNQSLKTNQGKPKWKEFFYLISNEFSKIEHTGYNIEIESAKRLPKLIKSLDIFKRFSAFQMTLDYIKNDLNSKNHTYCLLQLDTQKETGHIHLFKEEQFDIASRMYLEFEKNAAEYSNRVVALVNVSSIDNLQEAFPNYFADSTHFIEIVKDIYMKNSKPSTVTKFLTKILSKTGLENYKP